MPVSALHILPVWNNGILFTNGSIFISLRHSAPGTDTKLRERVYRALDILEFIDFF